MDSKYIHIFIFSYGQLLKFYSICFQTEIPEWLAVYSRASQELDHKLRWEMFRLPELDCFNAMLTRLYKQELEEIVMRYEAYR